MAGKQSSLRHRRLHHSESQPCALSAWGWALLAVPTRGHHRPEQLLSVPQPCLASGSQLSPQGWPLPSLEMPSRWDLWPGTWPRTAQPLARPRPHHGTHLCLDLQCRRPWLFWGWVVGEAPFQPRPQCPPPPASSSPHGSCCFWLFPLSVVLLGLGLTSPHLSLKTRYSVSSPTPFPAP